MDQNCITHMIYALKNETLVELIVRLRLMRIEKTLIYFTF